MTAEETFKELGYEIEVDLKDILIYKKEFALGAIQKIIFHKNDDGMYIEDSVNRDGTYFLSYKEISAINKQVEELGWNK